MSIGSSRTPVSTEEGVWLPLPPFPEIITLPPLGGRAPPSTPELLIGFPEQASELDSARKYFN